MKTGTTWYSYFCFDQYPSRSILYRRLVIFFAVFGGVVQAFYVVLVLGLGKGKGKGLGDALGDALGKASGDALGNPLWLVVGQGQGLGLGLF